ncbi:MAG: recombinase family protein, partial [bacterium]
EVQSIRANGCASPFVYFLLNTMTSVLELNNPSTHERKAVLYARVSSKEQEKEGFSIPSQLKLLREYGSTEGVRIAQEYVDVETAKLAGRANFGAMVTHLKANLSIRTLLVEKTDRLYRNLKDWVTLDELDVEIHFVKEGVVLSQDSRSSDTTTAPATRGSAGSTPQQSRGCGLSTTAFRTASMLPTWINWTDGSTPLCSIICQQSGGEIRSEA